MGKIIEAAKATCWHFILYSVFKLKSYCESNPTCKGCDFKEKHIGCRFRQGKTPREW